jgi:hypothetical protein
MLFPDDAEVRREAAIAYACRSLADEFSSSPSISFEISTDMAAFLYKAPRVEDLAGGRGEASVARLAELVGRALGFILRAAEHGHPKLASSGAVLRRLSQYEKRDLKTLKQAWSQYSCVAHLWASLDLIYEEDQKTLLVFLAAAEELRRRGEAHVPKGAKTPVLDPKTTWKVPSSIRLPPSA